MAYTLCAVWNTVSDDLEMLKMLLIVTRMIEAGSVPFRCCSAAKLNIPIGPTGPIEPLTTEMGHS